jgi:hypothetical protein
MGTHGHGRRSTASSNLLVRNLVDHPSGQSCALLSWLPCRIANSTRESFVVLSIMPPALLVAATGKATDAEQGPVNVATLPLEHPADLLNCSV